MPGFKVSPYFGSNQTAHYLKCSVLFSLSHLGRTVSDYKMDFRNVWGWGMWKRRLASRENITLKYTEIINHNPTSVMLRYETLLFNPDNISSKPQLEHGCTECEYSIT